MTYPNIIVFFTDQQRWDSMGLHGNPLDLTPNLERVALEGTHVASSFTKNGVQGWNAPGLIRGNAETLPLSNCTPNYCEIGSGLAD